MVIKGHAHELLVLSLQHKHLILTQIIHDWLGVTRCAEIPHAFHKRLMLTLELLHQVLYICGFCGRSIYRSVKQRRWQWFHTLHEMTDRGLGGSNDHSRLWDILHIDCYVFCPIYMHRVWRVLIVDLLMLLLLQLQRL